MITDTGGALKNAVVDLEIVNAAGRQVGQRIFTGQSLGAGQSASYSWQWTAPAQGGTYTVKVGVFGPAWSPLYFWAWQAAHIAVA